MAIRSDAPPDSDYEKGGRAALLIVEKKLSRKREVSMPCVRDWRRGSKARSSTKADVVYPPAKTRWRRCGKEVRETMATPGTVVDGEYPKSRMVREVRMYLDVNASFSRMRMSFPR